MKKKLREVIVPSRKGRFSNKQLKAAVNGAKRKKDVRDYYNEQGVKDPQILHRYIPMSKATLEKIKTIAKILNASVNYVVARLITERMRDLEEAEKAGGGDLVLMVLTGETANSAPTEAEKAATQEKLREQLRNSRGEF